MDRAAAFTKSLGIEIDVPRADYGRVIDGDALSAIDFCARAWSHEIGIERYALDPIGVNVALKKTLEAVLGTDLVLTLGYIQLATGEPFPFFCTEQHFSDWLSGASTLEKLRFHGWLSASTDEVIDLTFKSQVSIICHDDAPATSAWLRT